MNSSAERHSAWLYRKYQLTQKMEPVTRARQLGCTIISVDWAGNGWLMQLLIPNDRIELLLELQLKEYET